MKERLPLGILLIIPIYPDDGHSSADKEVPQIPASAAITAILERRNGSLPARKHINVGRLVPCGKSIALGNLEPTLTELTTLYNHFQKLGEQEDSKEMQALASLISQLQTPKALESINRTMLAREAGIRRIVLNRVLDWRSSDISHIEKFVFAARRLGVQDEELLVYKNKIKRLKEAEA